MTTVFRGLVAGGRQREARSRFEHTEWKRKRRQSSGNRAARAPSRLDRGSEARVPPASGIERNLQLDRLNDGQPSGRVGVLLPPRNVLNRCRSERSTQRSLTDRAGRPGNAGAARRWNRDRARCRAGHAGLKSHERSMRNADGQPTPRARLRDASEFALAIRCVRGVRGEFRSRPTWPSSTLPRGAGPAHRTRRQSPCCSPQSSCSGSPSD